MYVSYMSLYGYPHTYTWRPEQKTCRISSFVAFCLIVLRWNLSLNWKLVISAKVVVQISGSVCQIIHCITVQWSNSSWRTRAISESADTECSLRHTAKYVRLGYRMLTDVSWCCTVSMRGVIHMFYLDVHILFLEHKERNLERATWVLEARKGKEIHYIISIYYILKTFLYRKETNSFFKWGKHSPWVMKVN